jgi:hypothetical protein
MARQQGKAGHWLAIVMMLLVGAMLIRAAIVRDPGLHVPPIVAYVAAAVFFMGAIAVAKQLAGFHSTVDGLAPLILAGLTAIGAWIALSPDSGGCSIGASDGPAMEASGPACRIPFGIGALITGMLAVSSALAWIRARKGQRD